LSISDSQLGVPMQALRIHGLFPWLLAGAYELPRTDFAHSTGDRKHPRLETGRWTPGIKESARRKSPFAGLMVVVVNGANR
jgi:hypothetical protein